MPRQKKGDLGDSESMSKFLQKHPEEPEVSGKQEDVEGSVLEEIKMFLHTK